MLKFTTKSRVANLGKRKGQVLYFAVQERPNRVTLPQVEAEIVQRTALSKGDVRSAIASLAEVVNNALLRGDSVDLGDLGSLRVSVIGKHMDKQEEVTARTLKTPRIVYTPKSEMKAQAQRVSVSIANPKVAGGESLGSAGASTSTTGGASTSTTGGASTSTEDQGL